MARHLTPEERARVVARYQETANACEVAREFDISESTVRRYLSLSRSARKNDLHAQAVARGLRAGRRYLIENATRLDLWLKEHGDPTNPTMEPGDVTKMSQALRTTVGGLCDVQERIERRKQSLLTRQKTRAETSFLKARTDALSGLSSALANATDEELALVTQVIERARSRGPVASGQSGASAPQSGDDPTDDSR